MSEGTQAMTEQKLGEVQATTEQTTGEATQETVMTYTQEQVAKMQSTFEKKTAKAEQRALVAETKLNETSTALVDVADRLRRIEAENQERQFSGLEDLPGTEKLKHLYRTLSDKEEALTKQQREFDKVRLDAAQGLKFRDATTLAKKYGIDADELMECETYQGMVERVADLVAEKVNTKTVTPQAKASPLPKHIDSATSTGSGTGRVFKASEIDNMTSQEIFDNSSEIAKAQREGRIKMNE